MHVNLKFLVVFVFVIPLITTVLTYAFTIKLGKTNNQILPFISTTLDSPPGSCIGTGGLSITSTLIAVLTMVRMVYVRAWIKRTGLFKSVSTLHKLNVVGTVLGFGFVLCLIGVISVQWSVNHSVHNGFSAGLFLFGTFYMCVQTFMDVIMYKTRTLTKKWIMVLRIICSIFGVILYVPLIIFSRIHEQLWQAFGAAVEIAMTLLFVAFYCSYHGEWHDISLLVDIHWEELLPLMTHSSD